MKREELNHRLLAGERAPRPDSMEDGIETIYELCDMLEDLIEEGHQLGLTGTEAEKQLQEVRKTFVKKDSSVD